MLLSVVGETEIYWLDLFTVVSAEWSAVILDVLYVYDLAVIVFQCSWSSQPAIVFKVTFNFVFVVLVPQIKVL